MYVHRYSTLIIVTMVQTAYILNILGRRTIAYGGEYVIINLYQSNAKYLGLIMC